MFWSCLGSRRRPSAVVADEETAPLLPHYDDDTRRQRRLHQKLHTYQMLRAVRQGYLPSTAQLVVILRVIMGSGFLEHEEDERLSDAGRLLLHFVRLWLQQLVQLASNKNEGDKLQEFVWFLGKWRLHLDVDRLEERVSAAKRRADLDVVQESISTAFRFMLSNREFNLFLSDVSSVIRKILQSTAFTISEVSMDTGRKLQNPRSSTPDSKRFSSPTPDDGGETQASKSKEKLKEDAQGVTEIAAEGATSVVEETAANIAGQLSGEDRAAMLNRLKAAITSLRKEDDYWKSASTITNFIRRCLDFYSGLVIEVESELEADLEFNKETKKALANFWAFVQAFGDRREWQAVEILLKELVQDGRQNPEYAALIHGIGDLVQDMLLDPAFFESPEERFQELRQTAHEWMSNSSTAKAMDGLLDHLVLAIKSVAHDNDVRKLLDTSCRISSILFPKGRFVNEFLPSDLIHVMLPRIIAAIQYIPFPRLEISTTAMDLLLESLILEPGKTVNSSSFLPFRFRIESWNTLEVKKTRFGTHTGSRNVTTLKVEGLSLSAEEFSFWFRASAGLLCISDEGIASVALDERGVDVEVDVEICRKCPDRILSLRGVRVKIHKLDYTLQKSKFTCLAWVVKPILRPILRMAVQKKIAKSIENGLRVLNRELLFARERLRATRIANPDDLAMFVKAIWTRLQTSSGDDVYMRVGVDTGEGVFEGVYTPASLVKVWEEEAVEARKRVRAGLAGGWRNRIFDMPVEA